MSIGSQIEPASRQEQPSPKGLLKWHQRILGFCFAVFALEVGLFLLFFPWLPSWDLNWVPLQTAELRKLWLNTYFRGALSGIGLLNIYVSIVELSRLFRSLLNK